MLCAENFQGPSCTDCSRPGFTGPNCDEIDNCLGVDCGSGECVKDINSFSCTCDPGYTGERCEDTSKLSGYSHYVILVHQREEERERERERERKKEEGERE